MNNTNEQITIAFSLTEALNLYHQIHNKFAAAPIDFASKNAELVNLMHILKKAYDAS